MKPFSTIILSLLVLSILIYNIGIVTYLNILLFDYFLSFSNTCIPTIIFLEFSITFLTISSWLLFIYAYRKRICFLRFLNKGVSNLSITNRVILLSFTLFVSIPNRIFIHNNVSELNLYIITILTPLLLYLSPMLVFPLLAYIILLLESFMLGTMFETSETVRDYVNNTIFENDIVLASVYLQEFWGTPNSSSWEKIKIVVYGTAANMLGFMYFRSEHRREEAEVELRQGEIQRSRIQTWKSANPNKELTFRDIDEVHRDSRKQAFEEKAGTILKAIDTLDKLKKESMQNIQNRAYNRDEIDAMEAARNAVYEVERYNKNSLNKADQDRVKQKILEDSSYMQDMEILRNLRGSNQQVIEKLKNEDPDNNRELIKYYEGANDEINAKINSKIMDLNNSRYSFDSDENDDNSIE